MENEPLVDGFMSVLRKGGAKPISEGQWTPPPKRGQPWTATIPIALPDKGNSHGAGWKKNKHGEVKPGIFTSAEATANRRLAVMFLRALKPPKPPIGIQEKLAIYVYVRFKDYTRDGSIEILKDVLQQAEIVPDDVQFRINHFEVLDEIGEPETTINIFRVGVLPWTRKPKKR